MARRIINIPTPGDLLIDGLFGSERNINVSPNVAGGVAPSPYTNEGQDINTPTSKDPINDSAYYDQEIDSSGLEIPEDLVRFRIYDLANRKVIVYRCTITGLTDSHNAEWNQHKHVGRPYPVHYYTGVSRTLSFNFRTYANSYSELKVVWDKLNYTTALTQPARYENGFMVPPYVKLQIGDLYNRVTGYFSNINVTIPDDSSWNTKGWGYKYGNLNNLVLPVFADVNVSFTVIEDELKSPAKNMFGFNTDYNFDDGRE